LSRLARVFWKVGRFGALVAVCCAIGLHWVALQSVAWTNMLITYSKRGPLCQAITQTFDGAHPCSICHLVNVGKNSEKKSDLQALTPKLDMICVCRAVCLWRPFVLFEYPPRDFSFCQFVQSPPVPPPRSLPG
jgi:hypothetical protein